MSKTILIVEDEKDIVELLKYNLQKEGFNVLVAHNGKDALDKAKKIPNLILLDVMIPEPDGLEVTRRLKKDKETSQIPIILLTAKSTELDEVVGLELGADDYITKPVSIPRLLARIKKVIRNKENPTEKNSTIILDGVVIDSTNYKILIDKKEIFFPRKEFQLLLYLAENKGRVIKRDSILSAIWGDGVLVLDRTIDVHIRKIREKLGKYADLIQTIKGVGYRIED